MSDNISKEDRHWQKLSKDNEIIYEMRRYYKGKRVCDVRELARAVKVDRRTIMRYCQQGVPECEDLSAVQMKVFYYDDALEWVTNKRNAKKATKRIADESKSSEVTHRQTIDLPNNLNSSDLSINDKITEIENKLDAEIGEIEADRYNSILKAMTTTVKIKKELEELIPTREVDLAMAEVIGSLIATYKRDRDLLPRRVSNKDEESIRAIISSAFNKSIEDLQKQFKKHFKCKEKLFDVLVAVDSELKRGISPKQIISKLK